MSASNPTRARSAPKGASPAPAAPASVRVRRTIAAVLALPLIVMLVEALVVLVVCIPPSRSPGSLSFELRSQSTAAGGADYVDVRGEGGMILRGELLGDPSTRPVVVFGHSYRGHHYQALGLARALLAEGYAVLAFDFRGSGDSDGTLTYCGAAESEDVVAVLHYLNVARGVPPQRIAYVGSSMGAAAFLLGAGQAVPRVGACALLAPYADLEAAFDARTRRYAGLCLRPWFRPATWLFERLAGRAIHSARPIDHARELTSLPSLWVSGSEDWRAPARDIRDMAEAAGGTLLEMHGADHVAVTRPDDAVIAAVVTFLKKHVPAKQS